MEKYIAQHYEARSTYAFLPGELRELRNHLLSFNELFPLMIWTIIIVGIKLFLRVEEVLTMDMSQFDEDFFVVTEDAIQGLCVKIKAKRDPRELHFMMWDDLDCSEFSPVRAILIWLHASGIKSGRIFPTGADIEAKNPSPTDSYDYSSFLEKIKDLCSKVLRKDTAKKMKNMILGTHMLRKTAFLLAYWGFVLLRNVEDNRKWELDTMDHANILKSA